MHGTMPAAAPHLSVVIPARNAAWSLGECLAAVRRSAPPGSEVVVVDDCSEDDTPNIALKHGAVLVRQPRPLGPAAARNAGALRASNDLLLFLDSDVVVADDAIPRVVRAMADPALAAVFGSYDDAPACRALVSDYRNLLHHFVHQNSREDSESFWAGCGAIRRSVFLGCGGFDERYLRPSIEDIELGGRLAQAGHRVRLEKELHGKHLKRWTLFNVVLSDIRDRAYPWSRLILEAGRMPVDLNLRYRDRASAAFVWLALALAIGVAIVEAPWEAFLAAAMTAAVFAVLLLNRDFYTFLVKRRSLPRAIASFPLHLLYYAYGSATFAFVWLGHWARRLTNIAP